MKSHINSLLLALSAVLILSGNGYALDYDFSGNMQYHNNILQYTFTTNGSSNVTLFSSSWDDGNFDPMLGLWRSDGSLIQWQDDGHVLGTTDSNGVGYDHGNWDSYFSELLTAGTYIVTLSTFYNAPNGTNLSDGFSYDNQTPIPILGWDQPFNGNRGDYYEFHILGVMSAQPTSVPEPSTLLLLGAGLAGFGLMRRRARR